MKMKMKMEMETLIGFRTSRVRVISGAAPQNFCMSRGFCWLLSIRPWNDLLAISCIRWTRIYRLGVQS
ncbi:hypothetical protein L6452_15414 [Arctium lappa]|uniref:Uncharacterized protein n=4 Tax=Arctium lappa TaxID=4217 RepID=A0ACB8Y1U8_ARCLA|nr:hypothetical protein L6452_40177 [Arctium lappa]KAI3677570.1 hypothetical protein L6452_36836 [Arctium lappa]KAI3735889.1 hypothetical protein L6452_15412 [Arctium lappa]KAI3735891.1 hypothetical protein L6452_15414 [Arctium lappa]